MQVIAVVLDDSVQLIYCGMLLVETKLHVGDDVFLGGEVQAIEYPMFAQFIQCLKQADFAIVLPERIDLFELLNYPNVGDCSGCWKMRQRKYWVKDVGQHL